MPQQRVYCGTRDPLPLGYERIGTPYECLRKGVGVGKNLVNAPPVPLPARGPVLFHVWVPAAVLFVVGFFLLYQRLF